MGSLDKTANISCGLADSEGIRFAFKRSIPTRFAKGLPLARVLLNRIKTICHWLLASCPSHATVEAVFQASTPPPPPSRHDCGHAA